MTRAAVLALLLVIAGCRSAQEPSPEPFDTTREACSYCRMSGSDGRTAAQLVSLGESPLFFDDIGCLRSFLAERAGKSASTGTSFVVDHSTGEWIRADRAIYSQSEQLRTPMDSHLMAHKSDASRAGDPATQGATKLSFDDVFGSSGTKGSR